MGETTTFDVAAIKRAIIDHTGPGKKFTRRSLSLTASDGKNPDLVRDMISRGQDRNPSFQAVSGLAAALGVDVTNFLLDKHKLSPKIGPERITVMGAIEAGAWRQQDGWEPDRRYQVEVLPTDLPSENRFGLEVVGYSMDKIFPPGTVLDCFAIPGTPGLEPLPGDVVIVERKRSDLTETTCKRLEQLPDGNFQLRAESSRPEFADPIPLGKPDAANYGHDETRIIGVVNSAIMRVLRR